MIRELGAEEIPKAACLLADSFRHDPAFRHLIPDGAQRVRRLPSLFEALLRTDADRGAALRGAFDGDALVGVSSTLPAGAGKPRLKTWLRGGAGVFWAACAPAFLLRSYALAKATALVRPKGDDYLHLLAAHPASQGRGVGAALLRAALLPGRSVVLETFEPGNLAWYEARGFARVAQTSSPARPVFWTLRRAKGSPG